MDKMATKKTVANQSFSFVAVWLHFIYFFGPNILKILRTIAQDTEKYDSKTFSDVNKNKYWGLTRSYLFCIIDFPSSLTINLTYG